MKKLLFCLLAACTVISCSDDKDDDSYLSNVPEGKLAFIKITFDASLIDTPSDKRKDALLFLFPTAGKFIEENPKPYSFTYNGDEICGVNDVNNESVYCNYSGSFSQDKDASTGKYTMSYCTAAFTPNVLTLASYFSKGEYLIVIYINGTYFCHYETINPEGKYIDELHYNLVQTKNTSGYAERYIWF